MCKYPIKVDIHGSCVSREIFNHIDDNSITVGIYLFRNSLVACTSAPAVYDPSKIKLEGAFFSRMLAWDLNKEGLRQLETSGNEWLLMDLHDIGCVIVQDQGSLFTYCNEFFESEYYKERKGLYSLIHTYEMDKKILYDLLQRYAECIRKRYDSKHILLLKVRFAYKYLNADRQEIFYPEETRNYYRHINDCIIWVEERLKELLDLRIIDIVGDADYVADELHPQGLYGVHYSKDFYMTARDRVKEIICQRG